MMAFGRAIRCDGPHRHGFTAQDGTEQNGTARCGTTTGKPSSRREMISSFRSRPRAHDRRAIRGREWRTPTECARRVIALPLTRGP